MPRLSKGSLTIDWSEIVPAVEELQRQLSKYWPECDMLIGHVFSHHLTFAVPFLLCSLALTLPSYLIHDGYVNGNLVAVHSQNTPTRQAK